jgi:hypothetical protein
MYADGGNIPQIDEESPISIDAKFRSIILASTYTISSASAWLNSYSAAPVDPTTSALFGVASVEHLVQCYRRD